MWLFQGDQSAVYCDIDEPYRRVICAAAPDTLHLRLFTLSSRKNENEMSRVDVRGVAVPFKRLPGKKIDTGVGVKIGWYPSHLERLASLQFINQNFRSERRRARCQIY